MYLRTLELKDFRGFASLRWEVAAGEEAGWHVLMGPNGAGKTSVLRGMAIGLLGAGNFAALHLDRRDFIHKNTENAEIALELSANSSWDTSAPKTLIVRHHIALYPLNSWGGYDIDPEEEEGYFSAGFGPMRRFSGGNPDTEKLFQSHPRPARHLSLFGEDIALSEALEWLKTLRFQQLESPPDSPEGILLDRVRDFVNQDGFLPYGTQLGEVSSKGVSFIDGNGVTLPILELSDGYRAVLSLTFELIRQMAECYGAERLFSADKRQIVAPGVVLIDEVDAHLHPSWQRQIGPWLTRLFPQVQFIVTTHSPYVCQSATRGSVWVLPAPGEEGHLRRLEGDALHRALYGDVLHVLNSEAFGGQPGRSDEALAKLDRLTKLNRKHERGALSDAERQEREALLALLAPVLDVGHA
ncbi:AAA family ATPase [Rivihabitans pingtungensis]|uniref:AAA family ATPase n=1 Tax=Rivihabitans pingtungensis TaxID=1054498 RepID=UPI00235372FE|nr:AAA family ATPase [Rivihabitans pingtungensis]MCK6436643.1 AAA family ATPase [Rivihabitans pingtungensis]